MLRTLLTSLVERGHRAFAGLGRASRFLLALNGFCWLLFLTRSPVNAAEYATYKLLPGGGIEFTGSTASPYVVASRTVAKGGWHGIDTPPIEAYRLLNGPALLVGGLIYLAGDLGLMFGMLVCRALSISAAVPFDLPTAESWVLAGSLVLATTLQWLLVGRLADRFFGRFGTRAKEPLITRVLVGAFLLSIAALTAWWWPRERDWYLLSSSFDGKPAPILKALESEPANAELWRRLGRSYRMKDRWVEARPAYRRSVELDPTDFDAWADLRLASLCLDDQGEAERAAKQLFVLDRKWAESRVADPPKCCAFEVCPK